MYEEKFYDFIQQKLGEANKSTGFKKSSWFNVGILLLEMQFECMPEFSFSALILLILIENYF